MSSIPENVGEDLITLVPASLISEISCFVFYDNHPRDEKKLEVIICTIRGEVREYFQRELVFSTIIDRCSKPTDIKMLRNCKRDIFYLVSFNDEVTVLSRRNKLEIVCRVDNVDSYEVEDTLCNGQASLKIIRKDDAVPLIFDDNFERLEDQTEMLSKTKDDDSLPILTQLSRKLTEAKYSMKCNEKAYKDLLRLRQLVSFDTKSDAKFSNKNDQSGALHCRNTQPFIYKCDRNLVLALEVLNTSTVPAEDIHFLIHSTTESSISYTNKIFVPTPATPYWKEVISIHPNTTCYVILVIDLLEHKQSISGQFDLDSVISYKCSKQENFLKSPKICVSASEMMSVESNITKIANNLQLLLMLAVTERTDLCIRHIGQEELHNKCLIDLFQSYLQMETFKGVEGDTIDVVYKSSPFNILHGIIVFYKERFGSNCWIISLHTRTPSQILAFIHYVHDSIPHRLLITTTNQKITSKLPELSVYNEDTTCEPKLNYTQFGASIVNQAALTLEFLDNCMMKMNESKDSSIQNRIGREIDIPAGDLVIFKKKLLQEAELGIKNILKEESNGTDEGMIIDID